MKQSILSSRVSWPQLSRRGFLSPAAAVMIPSLQGQASTPACVLTSGQEEGPYYVDGSELRSDIIEGKPGKTLPTLAAGSCISISARNRSERNKRWMRRRRRASNTLAIPLTSRMPKQFGPSYGIADSCCFRVAKSSLPRRRQTQGPSNPRLSTPVQTQTSNH